MQKMIIGMLTACVLAVGATSAHAAVATRKATVKVVQKAKPLVVKAFDGVKKFLWRNKEGIAVGAAATAVVLKPEVIVGGPASLIFNPYVGTILCYMLVAGLMIAGARYLLRRLGLWRVLPLLVLALLLSCGVAEAAVIGDASFPAIQCGVPGKAWWDLVMIVVMIVTMII